MIRLLAALALSLCLAAPAKALVLETGDFVDFRADISNVPDTDDFGAEYRTFTITFLLNSSLSAGPGDLVFFESVFGTSLGGSDVGNVVTGSIPTTGTHISFSPTKFREDVSGDEIFTRLTVTSGTFDVIGVEALYESLFRAIPVDVTQVSAVPLPASLVLLLSGLGAIGLVGRRRRAA